MPEAYRIVEERAAEHAFSGEGARQYGGRWNSVGTAVIYTASTLSLAILEMLVHFENESSLARQYVYFKLSFDEGLVERYSRARLPTGWNAAETPSAAQAVGDKWVASGRSAVLEIPSAVVTSEWNYLLNPAHPDFRKVKIGKQTPMAFDPRLK